MTPSDVSDSAAVPPSSTPAASAPTVPGIGRRLLGMFYEAFTLTAVNMLAVALYLVVTRNRHGDVYEHGLKAFLFLVTGAYFIFCWTDSGHTLAMKTWRLRLVADGHPRVPLRTATLRYLLAWGWFLPALALYAALGLNVKDKGLLAAFICGGIAAWACTALFDRDRRFLHDRIAGTRFILLPKRGRAAPAKPQP